MWSRAELKEKAKAALKQHYWKIVLVAILAGLVGGGSSVNIDTSSYEESFEQGFEAGYNDTFYEMEEDELFYEDEYYVEDSFDMEFSNEGRVSALAGGVVAILMFIITIVCVIAAIVTVFVYYPLEIGTNRFFLKSLSEKPEVKEIAFAYDNGYKNVIKILFLRNLYTALWSMLFVIPGIVKSYEYQMIPYLLAENPHMTKEEAFRLSKQMMTGNKMEAFVLDLSFIGWDILSGFTLGILSIFYVQPYKYLTYAALYEELSAINGYPARATIAQPNVETPYIQPEYTQTTSTTEETYNSPE